MQAESDHHHGQQHCGHVAHIAQRFHQGNASHLPVVTQHDGGQQQPGIEGKQVGIGQNPGESGYREMEDVEKEKRWIEERKRNILITYQLSNLDSETKFQSIILFILFISGLKCLAVYLRIQ